MASRAVDALITYRIIKLLVTPFERQEAFKYGIIDADGKVLKKSKTLKTERERKAYTVLHRFIFNLKRILKRVGLGSRIGSFAVALALLIKENKEYEQHKLIIESAIITYLKQTNQYDNLLNEEGEVPTFEPEQDVYCNCFGIDIYELEAKSLVEKKISLPAYDQCLKASHVFNILDARGAISVVQRAEYTGRIRDITKAAAGIWLDSQS